jgi:hypothetical protein
MERGTKEGNHTGTYSQNGPNTQMGYWINIQAENRTLTQYRCCDKGCCNQKEYRPRNPNTLIPENHSNSLFFANLRINIETANIFHQKPHPEQNITLQGAVLFILKC